MSVQETGSALSTFRDKKIAQIYALIYIPISLYSSKTTGISTGSLLFFSSLFSSFSLTSSGKSIIKAPLSNFVFTSPNNPPSTKYPGNCTVSSKIVTTFLCPLRFVSLVFSLLAAMVINPFLVILIDTDSAGYLYSGTTIWLGFLVCLWHRAEFFIPSQCDLKCCANGWFLKSSGLMFCIKALTILGIILASKFIDVLLCDWDILKIKDFGF